MESRLVFIVKVTVLYLDSNALFDFIVKSDVLLLAVRGLQP